MALTNDTTCSAGKTCCAKGALPPPMKCCPADQTPSGCMHMGGSSTAAGECPEMCDFFCSTNWRIVRDSNGCDGWTYDHRSPTPDENAFCFPQPDSGAAVDAAGH